MQIKKTTFNALAVVAGIVFTGLIWHHMATNPRWEGDKGPGVGKLPRQIVNGFITKAYDEGKGAEAVELYMEKRTVDHAPDALDRQNGEPLKRVVHRIVAEGLNVVIWHCIEPARGEPATEVVDFFKTRGGRIIERHRVKSVPLDTPNCPASKESQFTGLK